MLKFEGNQELFYEGKPVIVSGRTEFFDGRQPRYYVQGEGGESWVNENTLTDVSPVVQTSQDPPLTGGIRGKKTLRRSQI